MDRTTFRSKGSRGSTARQHISSQMVICIWHKVAIYGCLQPPRRLGMISLVHGRKQCSSTQQERASSIQLWNFIQSPLRISLYFPKSVHYCKYILCSMSMPIDIVDGGSVLVKPLACGARGLGNNFIFCVLKICTLNHLLPSCNITEIMLKRRKSSKRPPPLPHRHYYEASLKCHNQKMFVSLSIMVFR